MSDERPGGQWGAIDRMGRVAIVTGGGSAIGQVSALGFATAVKGMTKRHHLDENLARRMST